MMYVCRLCSSDKNVIDLFHSELKYGEKLRFCILLATGIEIQKGDVSTMICQNCCEIAVKLYKYRVHAISNDQVLKQKSGQAYELPALDPEKLKKIAVSLDKNFFNDSEPTHRIKELDERISNSDDNVTVLKVGTSLLKISRVSSGEALSSVDNSNNSLQEICKLFKSVVNVHPSVKKILNENKSIILPVEVYGNNVSPLVSIDTEPFEDWRAKQIRHVNLELEDILPDGPLSIDACKNSNDSNTVTTNRRKRNNRQIIVDYDSDNDVPDKIPKTVCDEAVTEVSFGQNAITTTNLQKPTSRTTNEQASLTDSRIKMKSSSNSDKVTPKDVHKEVSSGSGNVNMLSPTNADKSGREDLIIKFVESRSTVESTDDSDQVTSKKMQKRAHIDDIQTTNQNLKVPVVSDRRSITDKSSSNSESTSTFQQRLGIVCNVEVDSKVANNPRTESSELQITILSDSDGDEDISKKLQTPTNKHNLKTYSKRKAVARDRKNIAVEQHANNENVAVATSQTRIVNESAFDASKDNSKTVQKRVSLRRVSSRNLQSLPVPVASKGSVLPKADSKFLVISKSLEVAHASANGMSEQRYITAVYAHDENVVIGKLQQRIRKKLIKKTVRKRARPGSNRAKLLESLQPQIIIECDSDSEEDISKKPLNGTNNCNAKTSVGQTNTMDNVQSKHENVISKSLQPRIAKESASISETQKTANVRNELAKPIEKTVGQNLNVSVASDPGSTTVKPKIQTAEIVQSPILNERPIDNNKDISCTVQKGVPVRSVGNRNLSVPIVSERSKILRPLASKSDSDVDVIAKKPLKDSHTPVKNHNVKSSIQTSSVPVTNDHTRTIDKSQSKHGNLASESSQPRTANVSASASTTPKGDNIRNETAKNQNLNDSVGSGSQRTTVKPQIQTAEASQSKIPNKCASECNKNTSNTIKNIRKRKLRTRSNNLPVQGVRDRPRSFEISHPRITIECDSDSEEDSSKKLQKDAQGRSRSVGDQYEVKKFSQNVTAPLPSANGDSRNQPQSNQEKESSVPQILIESDSESEVTSQNESKDLRSVSPTTPSGNSDRPTSDANPTDRPSKNLAEVNEHGSNIETNEPSAAVSCDNGIISIEDDADVICLSDDQEPTTRSMPHLVSDVMLLFTKHYKFDCKPETVVVKCKNKGTTILQNMVSELRKHSVPVEMGSLGTNEIAFLKNDGFNLNSKKQVSDVWLHEDCTDIQKPAGQMTDIVPKFQNTNPVQKRNGGYQVIYRTAIPTTIYKTTSDRTGGTSLKKASLSSPATSLNKSHGINDSNIKSPASQVTCPQKIGYTKNQQFGVIPSKYSIINTYSNKKKTATTQTSTTGFSSGSISNDTEKSISSPIHNVSPSTSLPNIKMASSLTSFVFTPMILQPVTVTTNLQSVTQTTCSIETSTNEFVNNHNSNFKTVSMDKFPSFENPSANVPISVIPITHAVSNSSESGVVNNSVTSSKADLSFYPANNMVISKVPESPEPKQTVKVSPTTNLVPIDKSSKSWQKYNSLVSASAATSGTVTATVTSRQSNTKQKPESSGTVTATVNSRQSNTKQDPVSSGTITTTVTSRQSNIKQEPVSSGTVTATVTSRQSNTKQKPVSSGTGTATVTSRQSNTKQEPVSSGTVTATVTSRQSNIKQEAVSSEVLEKSQPLAHQQPALAHRRIGVIRVKNLSELLKK